ncbi:polysaccharide deacetylase family protein [Enterococcus sp. AZ008]|uniref:polysaccharide deacetylase family protein n=1 Tax=Enterococcus sp. AZ008 TaxID=2774821 RepID=UPI003F278D79
MRIKILFFLLISLFFLSSCNIDEYLSIQRINNFEDIQEGHSKEKTITTTSESNNFSNEVKQGNFSSDDIIEEKTVALTFDDGPDPNNTPKLLDILKQEKVNATFFVLGQNAQQYPEIVKVIANQGHEVGNHTYSHRNLSSLNIDELSTEITATDEVIKNITGEYPKYVRPPYGSLNRNAVQVINRPIIEWSVDSEDWRSRNVEEIIKKVQSTVYDGSIILLHDIHSETIQAIPTIIRILKEQGYAFKNISNLLGNPIINENYYGKDDHRPVEN